VCGIRLVECEIISQYGFEKRHLNVGMISVWYNVPKQIQTKRQNGKVGETIDGTKQKELQTHQRRNGGNRGL